VRGSHYGFKETHVRKTAMDFQRINETITCRSQQYAQLHPKIKLQLNTLVISCATAAKHPVFFQRLKTAVVELKKT
jgi:hypothetical protein